MSDPLSKLEQQLGELSQWDDADASTWKSAAASAGLFEPDLRIGSQIGRDGQKNGRSNHWWNRRIPYGPIAAALLLCGMLGALLLPSVGEARRRSVRSMSAAATAPAELRDSTLQSRRDIRAQFGIDSPAMPSERSIIRRFDLEFTTPDVRAAFVRLPGLLSEVRGEYVEQSSFSGTGANTVASVTVRVPSDRLGAVLASLRELGNLTSEASSGEDVTEQVVDLDARLRNEQRVEKELLSLLESRSGAPLKEILELRESLKTVREQIEKLSAQQLRIGRLVSLATIRISIRTEPPVPVVEASPGFWNVASDRISATWDDSLKIALNAFTSLLAIVIGGSVWWILLALTAFVGFKILRRYQSQSAHEPPPRL